MNKIQAIESGWSKKDHYRIVYVNREYGNLIRNDIAARHSNCLYFFQLP